MILVGLVGVCDDEGWRLDDDDHGFHLIVGSGAAFEEAQKKKKKRRRNKKKGASGDNGAAPGGNASDDSDDDGDDIVQAKEVTPPVVAPPAPPEGHGLDPMVHLVAECCKAGFSKEEVRSTIDEMWDNGQAYDDPEAVIRALKQKKSAVHTTKKAITSDNKASAATTTPPTQNQQQQSSKTAPPAPSTTKAASHSSNGHAPAPSTTEKATKKKVVEAPVAAPAPSKAPVAPEVVEEVPVANAKSSRAAALEQAASHDSVEDALAALVGWTHLAPSNDLGLFFSSQAPELLLRNVLEHSLQGGAKNYPSCLRDPLSQLLTRLLGPGVVAGPLGDLLGVIRHAQSLNSRHKLSPPVVESLAKVLASYLRNYRTQADVAGTALTEIPVLKARIAANAVAGRGANKSSRHAIPIRDLFMLRDDHHEAASLYHVGVRLLWNPFQQADSSAEAADAAAARLAISEILLQDVLDIPASAIAGKRKEVSEGESAFLTMMM